MFLSEHPQTFNHTRDSLIIRSKHLSSLMIGQWNKMYFTKCTCLGEKKKLKASVKTRMWGGCRGRRFIKRIIFDTLNLMLNYCHFLYLSVCTATWWTVEPYLYHFFPVNTQLGSWDRREVLLHNVEDSNLIWFKSVPGVKIRAFDFLNVAKECSCIILVNRNSCIITMNRCIISFLKFTLILACLITMHSFNL